MADQLGAVDTDVSGYAGLPDAPENHLRRRHSLGSKNSNHAGPNMDSDLGMEGLVEGAQDPLPSSAIPPKDKRTATSAIAATAQGSPPPPPPPPPPPQDTDTCRICRAEGTPEEPLFYPCKCSGSIKFVHQNCLMEWLSHSQKKHCELCKTSFRFTKLYSPNMPQRLPVHVFISHVGKYVLRNVLVWMRALLVMGVWLGWLPFCMRMTWSTMFWVSDFGFGGTTIFGYMPNPPHDDFSTPNHNATSAAAWASASSLVGANGTCPVVNPLSTSVSPLGGLMYDGDPGLLSFHGINLTGADPSLMAYLRFLLAGFGLVELDGSPKLSHRSHAPEHISLLSEVGFLRNLTRNSFVNNAVISVLEGQIITVLVVICFILIILVRDYVVQQQPEINMRAAFAAENMQFQPQIEDQDGEEEEDDAQNDAQHDDGEAEGGQVPAAPAPEQEDDDIASVGEDDRYDEDAHSAADHDNTEEDGETGDWATRLDTYLGPPPRDDGESGPPESSVQATAAGSRASGTDTMEPRLPEHRVRVEGATVQEYLRIYREADGDHNRILQIIQDENLGDKMQYWAQLTRAMSDRRRQSEESRSRGGDGAGPSNASQSDVNNASTMATVGGSGSSIAGGNEAEGDGNNGEPPRFHAVKEWQWPDDLAVDTAEQSPANKPGGKGKAVDGSSEEEWDRDTPSGSSSSVPAPENANTEATPPEFNFNTAPPLPVDDTGEQTANDGPPRRGPIANTEDFMRALREERAATDVHAEGEDQLVDDETRDTPREIHVLLPEQNEEPANRRRRGGLVDNVADFMWGPVEALVVQENLPDADPAGLANPPVDNHGPEPDELELLDLEDPADLEQEAIEDAEDFDGIMELFGMRGPLFGLFQNALFCALLVAVTVFFAVFLPYNVGRVSLWVTANPGRTFQLFVLMSQFLEDVFMTVAGGLMYGASTLARLIVAPFDIATEALRAAVAWSSSLASSSFWGVATTITSEYAALSSADVNDFSAMSHTALYEVKDHIGTALSAMAAPFVIVFAQNETAKWEAAQLLANGTNFVWDTARNLSATMLKPSSWVVNMPHEPAAALEPVYWNSWDRFLAILFGYLTLTASAAMYLSRGRQLVGVRNNGQGWDNSLVDSLNQASGVMKVVLIISIEMLVFPLYCGLLLDVALMPLFENTTIETRIQFTINNPATSIFVHWFVGTGYMFHFALFVSMCRKIMRPGVLYFIRDPDDPEFHPVRDVLERNVATQLRKILFSAFVYGALVIVCLGGVVWGLWFALPSVLPIHYSSNEPVLEFPIDLLFYNFLMPLAVKFFKPSDGLHKMYTWWFRKCARMLRITFFLFNERRIDEEGTLALGSESPYRHLPFWKTIFLEVNPEEAVVKPKRWDDTFEIGKGQLYTAITSPERLAMNKLKTSLITNGELVLDGRFVRSPSSDRVKIPKGQEVFLEVDETDTRFDGLPDEPDSDLYSNRFHYQFVYIPPRFKVRVFLFILFTWLFAAATGVGFTIIPLVFGRRMFKLWLPEHVRTNDIYAFSIGVYVLGSAAYGLFHLRALLARGVASGRTAAAGLNRNSVTQAARATLYAAKLAYTYFVILVAFPLLVSIFMELYVVIPLHTHMYGILLPPSSTSSSVSASLAPVVMGGGGGADSISGGVEKRHTVRIVQSWTLGLVYLKLLARFLAAHYEGTRLASSVRAVLRRGWLHPDAGVLTRAFVIPALFLIVTGILGPMLGARAFVRWSMDANVPGGTWLLPTEMTLVYRLAYPAAAIMAAGVAVGYRAVGLMGSWRTKIRDEAYLVGERLHNFSVGRSGRRTGGGHAHVNGHAAGGRRIHGAGVAARNVGVEEVAAA